MTRHRPHVLFPDAESPEAQERLVAREVRGHRQAGSGASKYAKGDVLADHFLIECVLPDTPIMVADGCFVRADAIRAGDSVVGGDGRLHRVKEVFVRSYSGDVICLRAKYDSRTIALTPDHPVLVRRDGGEYFIPAAEVVPHRKGGGDFVVRPVVHREIADGQVEIPNRPRAKSKIVQPLPIDESLAAWTGFYVAEGHVNQGKVVFTFASHEEKTYGRDVISLSKRLFGKVPNVYRRPQNHSFNLTMGQSSVAEWIAGACGKLAGDKHVPEFLLGASPSVIGAFLTSLFNGDGHNSSCSIGLSSKSEVLLHQVRALCAEFGVSTSFSPASRGCFQLRGFGVNAEVFRTFAGWESRPRSHRMLTSMVDEGRIFSRVFRSCARHYDGPVFNFHVEDDERYVCGSMCVHNCKRTVHASLSIKKSWLDKIAAEAAAAGKEPALAIEIAGGPNSAHGERDWVMCPLRVWKRLIGGVD
jgi:hypothetical protein